MDGNIETGLRRFASNEMSDKQRFILSPSGTAQYAELGELFPAKDGVPHVYTSATDALAQCVTGRGDVIYTTPDFTTALTAAELLSAETKGVHFIHLCARVGTSGEKVTQRATGSLPAGTQSALFTVTGAVKILAIKGQVTDTVQTQTCNTKLVANPTVGADVDICATTDITAAAIGSNFSITGTFANGLVVTASGAYVYQAAPTVVLAGTIDLSTSATNTGSVKWEIFWVPMEPGARVFAA
ncbi:MAG: hypothetical protein WC776_04880 [Patescibacteria group bacterium]|jgi:hypothetical protein